MKNEFNDIGEKWLKENDPLYGDRKNSSYLTNGMMNWAEHMEIPVSCIKEMREKFDLNSEE